jgi:hypothetical protein
MESEQPPRSAPRPLWPLVGTGVAIVRMLIDVWNLFHRDC